ncbi:S16 family serine protease [Desulfogranum marinum]|uniref:S16 family serine protease n=1 Tax=Desulfogranum marinum TaxID=453220 RepID=UPI0019634AA5|nr:S16 family serine protease [Desulfogranum marinum]MBM9514762.1 response regulator [Desulfogranum marinum]
MFFKKRANKTSSQEEVHEHSSLTDLKTKIEATDFPPHASEAAHTELQKLEQTDPAMAEYTVGINYIDLLLDLPWRVSQQGNFDLERAKRILDARHCGLQQIKQLILEFLAVKTLREQSKPQILIVDDEAIARTNMEHVLTKEGYQCFTAANGAEALEILPANEIDLVITDLKMNRMDGIELLDHITRLNPETPVIIVTGFATVDTAVKALKKGAANYLGKPVNLDELKRTVKDVLEHRRCRDVGKSPILCFSGPPGTGKTSIGKAIADALQRQFVRVSVGGLRDEAELRGHRRTYVGAMPGRILTELRRSKINNPIFMLDELDKIGQDFRGDPASVLLEILDPEQNSQFVDHYLDIPFDLSDVMFMATANDLSRLPLPLLDRMEIVHFTGYTEREKLNITQQYIIPRQLKATGLNKSAISFTDDAISRLINNYTREPGLRNLEREVASVCRKIALLKLASGEDNNLTVVDKSDVVSFLGAKKFFRETTSEGDHTGITTGLVWSESGGEIISIETVKMPGNGGLILTGSLGEILQESAHTVLSLIRSKADEFAIPHDIFQQYDIHIHIPAGSIAKDGPSAGIPIFAALLSLLTDRMTRPGVASTGEITLSGRILPVSGIREKVMAAQRAGISKVLVPKANHDEVLDLPEDVIAGIDVQMIHDIKQVINFTLAPAS